MSQPQYPGYYIAHRAHQKSTLNPKAAPFDPSGTAYSSLNPHTTTLVPKIHWKLSDVFDGHWMFLPGWHKDPLSIANHLVPDYLGKYEESRNWQCALFFSGDISYSQLSRQTRLAINYAFTWIQKCELAKSTQEVVDREEEEEEDSVDIYLGPGHGSPGGGGPVYFTGVGY